MSTPEHRQYSRDYYARTIDRRRETSRESYQRHKSKRLAYQKQYRAERREQLVQYQRDYYQQHKARMLQRTRDRYNNQREKISAIKLESGCIRCGFNENPATLDFHHTDSSTKEGTIASFANRSAAWVQAEIKKCIVLCANCHRIEHH